MIKKLILISALLFSFNGWAEDEFPIDLTNMRNFEITSTETLVVNNQENKKKKKRLSRKERKALERKEKAIESYKGIRKYDNFSEELSFWFNLTKCENRERRFGPTHPWYLGIYVRQGQEPAFKARRSGDVWSSGNFNFEYSYISQMDIKVNDNSPITIIDNNRDFGGWDRGSKQTTKGSCVAGICTDSRWERWEEKYNFIDRKSLVFLLQLAEANEEFLNNKTPVKISLRGYTGSNYLTYSCSSAGAEYNKFPLIMINFNNALKETETGSSLE